MKINVQHLKFMVNQHTLDDAGCLGSEIVSRCCYHSHCLAHRVQHTIPCLRLKGSSVHLPVYPP